MAKANPIRFSTQYTDDETDFLMYVHRPYGASQGRFLSRDPLDELSFRARYLTSLQFAERLAIEERIPCGHEFRAVQNDPVGEFDILGLCPKGTCDKWRLDIVLVAAVARVVYAKASLAADHSCCMNDILDYNREYQYIGLGAAVGLKLTLNIDVGGKEFKTPCIRWPAHDGLGSLSGFGAGAPRTRGFLWVITPQTHTSFTTPSWGIDGAIFSTVGFWKSLPQPPIGPRPDDPRR